MNSLEIKGRRIPRLWLGTSPFIGAGQFGKLCHHYYRNFYLQPENMVEIMTKAAELEWGIQPFALPNVIAALQKLRENYPQASLLFICGMQDFEEELKTAVKVGATAVGIHAMITDSNSAEELRSYVSKIKAAHLLSGFATHNPARTLGEIEKTEADFVLVPVNKTWRLMGSNPQLVPELIKNYPKIVIAKKILAAGTLQPAEALQYIVELGIKAICIGITAVEQMTEIQDILAKLNFAG